MCKIDKRLAIGLVVLALTAVGCSKDDKECEISCADGFTTKQDGSCDTNTLSALAAQHGGKCTGTEHN
jgi:hypothetical protein